MATRTSFRPRPVDISRQLNIVRDVAELDNTDELEQGATPGPAPSEQVPHTGPQKKKKEVKEIPVPEVRIVPGYTREYLPIFRIPDTYIRGKGGVGWTREDYCEYDLDNEDEDWLEAFNAGGANRLTEDKFEAMLWRLETANAEANQRLMSEPGYATDWRMLPAAVAATSNMSRDEALAVLRRQACARDAILHAVYDYWRGKRERWGKPIMRRLQAPTNPSDTNPYNVFRPRERVNRPQTRRRRENTHDCLDKMRQIRESMLRSLELTELLTFREARKRDLHRLDVDMQRYQLTRHHQQRQQQDTAEAEAAAQLREVQARSKQGESRLRAYLDSGGALGGAGTSYDVSLRRALMRKRRRQDMEGCANAEAIGRLPPPPLPADDEMLMLFAPDFDKLLGSSPEAAANGSSGVGGGRSSSKQASQSLIALAPGLDLSCMRARIGRCGRPMLTRCDPFTLEPHPPAPPPDAAEAGSSMEGGAGVLPALSPMALRHPLLISSQQPNVPWAATLDLEWLPEGIADKSILRTQRERRLNADRLNAAALRQTQLALQQQAAGGIVGSAGLAGAAAAAAAAPEVAAATAAATIGTAAAPAPAAPAPAQRPPPPPAVPNQGAPAGTLPHVPAAGAPAGTLPHLPAPGAAGAPATSPPPGAAQPGGSGGGAGGLAGPEGSGSLAGTPLQPPSAAGTPQPAPGSGGAQARKVPKVAGAPSAGAAPPQPGTAAAGVPAAAARSPAPGGPPMAPKPTGSAGPGPGSAAAAAPSGTQPYQPLGAAPLGASTPAPSLCAPGAAGPLHGAVGAGGMPPGGASSGGAGPGSLGMPPAGAVTPGSAGAAGAVKKMLPTSKAVAGPSSASQLKRGPGRPPKAAKANGDGLPPPPPSSTTVPMDML